MSTYTSYYSTRNVNVNFPIGTGHEVYSVLGRYLHTLLGKRGTCYRAEWHVDNTFEELDSPAEWFYDDKTNMLYFDQNGTSLPEEGVAPILDELIVVMRTQDQPVMNITIANLTLAHTAAMYLSSYKVPTGGYHRCTLVYYIDTYQSRELGFQVL